MIKKRVQLEISEPTLDNWQSIVDILAEILAIPAALIMKKDDPHIEVLVSSRSKGNPYHPGERERLWGSGLYCETVIKSEDKLLVPDALADDHWKDNPDVKLNMISYLGFPIIQPDGEPFGTICVLDNKENSYSETFEKLLLKFRDLIQASIEIIYMNQVLGEKNRNLTDYLMEIQALRGFVSICSNCKSIRDAQGHWRPIESYLIKHPEADFSHSFCPDCYKKLYSKYDLDT